MTVIRLDFLNENCWTNKIEPFTMVAKGQPGKDYKYEIEQIKKALKDLGFELDYLK